MWKKSYSHSKGTEGNWKNLVIYLNVFAMLYKSPRTCTFPPSDIITYYLDSSFETYLSKLHHHPILFQGRFKFQKKYCWQHISVLINRTFFDTNLVNGGKKKNNLRKREQQIYIFFKNALFELVHKKLLSTFLTFVVPASSLLILIWCKKCRAQ